MKEIDYKVYSIEFSKGGVGKSTMALSLSLSLISQGIKVQRKDYSVSDGYKLYLWEEYNNPNIVLLDWNKYIHSNDLYVTQGFGIDIEEAKGFVKKNFNHFYKTICYALLRMIDSVQDFGIMLNAVLYTIQSDAPRVMNTPPKL